MLGPRALDVVRVTGLEPVQATFVKYRTIKKCRYIAGLQHFVFCQIL